VRSSQAISIRRDISDSESVFDGNLGTMSVYDLFTKLVLVANFVYNFASRDMSGDSSNADRDKKIYKRKGKVTSVLDILRNDEFISNILSFCDRFF
jgi:hypothetical protein